MTHGQVYLVISKPQIIDRTKNNLKFNNKFIIGAFDLNFSFSISDDFVEFENDQANQNCHGKKFYSKEDSSVSNHSINELNDPLGSTYSKRYSNNISDKDHELAILSQSLIDNESNEKQSRVKESKSHDQMNFGQETL